MPDLIRHPVYSWIPAFAGMTIFRYLIAGVISSIAGRDGGINSKETENESKKAIFFLAGFVLLPVCNRYSCWKLCVRLYTALVRFADMLFENGVMFNYQSDWNFLLAAANYDTGTQTTNGKNIIRYLREDLGFEVDTHAHETQYNYADVAYLIEALGVNPSGTVGDFLAEPPEDSKLEYLWNPISGNKYPFYSLQPEILWGGATLHHINEEAIWASGIWNPKDRNHFLEHDNNSPLPYVGGYGRDNCSLLIQKQKDGDLEDGKIYTCTLFVSQTSLLQPDFIQRFEEEIQSYNNAGNIRWEGLAEVIDIWRDEFKIENSRLSENSNFFPNQGLRKKLPQAYG